MSEKPTPKTKVTLIKSDKNALDTLGISEISDYFDKSTLDEMLELKLVPPEYNPKALYDIVEISSALQPCIDAYAQAVSGTGYAVQRRITDDIEETQNINLTNAQKKAMDEDKTKLTELLSAPYPEKSFNDIRKKIRKDVESTGTGYVEIVFNASGDPIMFRNQPSTLILSSKLSKPIEVEVTVVRGNKLQKIKMKRRVRKYMMKLNGKKIWFKDHVCPYHIDKDTGHLFKELPAKKRGNILVPFKIGTRTDYDNYGRPRWLAAVPNILGIRSKEELNLHFLQSGGIPPALIFVMGGGIQSETVRKQLEGILSGTSQEKMKAAIVEIDSTGSFEANTVPKVDIKTFSSSDQNDPMFGGYSGDARKIIREIYRLSPLFLGGSEEFSHAAAQTALISTEALVFSELRSEEDNFYNKVIFPIFGIYNAKIQSNPLTMRNPELMQKLIDMILRAQGVVIPAANLISELNRIAGTNLKLSKGQEDNDVTGLISVQGQSGKDNKPLDEPVNTDNQDKQE